MTPISLENKSSFLTKKKNITSMLNQALIFQAGTCTAAINMVAIVEDDGVYEDMGPMMYEVPDPIVRQLPRIPHEEKDSDITCELQDCPAYGTV